MPRQSDEEDDAAPQPPILTTPTKVSRNDGASHADSDAEDPATHLEEEEELGAKKIRQPRHVLKYVVL